MSALVLVLVLVLVLGLRVAPVLLALVTLACSDAETAAPLPVPADALEDVAIVADTPAEDSPAVPDVAEGCLLVPLLDHPFESAHGFVFTGGARLTDGVLLFDGESQATLEGAAVPGRVRLELRLQIDTLPVSSELSFTLGPETQVSVTRDPASAAVRARLSGAGSNPGLQVPVGGEFALTLERDEDGVSLSYGGDRVEKLGPTGDPSGVAARLAGVGSVRLLDLTLSACDREPACTDAQCGVAGSCGAKYCNPLLGCGSIAVTVACNDGVACTVDSCGADGCAHSPTDSACDDSKPCNGSETCDVTLGCRPGAPPVGCCTVDADCTDNTLCSGIEACIAGTCHAGVALVCNDGNACNGTESCAATTGCVPGVTPVCDDGNVCNGVERCLPAVGCDPGEPLDCSDASSCTEDVCDPIVGCQVSLLKCDDNNVCNGFEYCDASSGCRPGTPLSCEDDRPCDGVETCEPTIGCVAGDPPLGCCAADFDCEDGVLCNGVATCDASNGQCHLGAPLFCDDKNLCNGTEICDVLLGCVSGPALACSDGNVCNGNEHCDAAVGCVAGQPLDCLGDNVCAGTAWCEPADGCRSGAPAVCDDGNSCNGLERCDSVVGCTPGTPLGCDDGRPCNGSETCEPTIGCVIGAIPPGCCTAGAPCDDANPCNGAWTCNPGTGSCELEAPPLVCTGGDLCGAASVCLPATGCAVAPSLVCDDGNSCNGTESCVFGGCIRTLPIPCDDGLVCNGLEVCDSAKGCLPGAVLLCSDGNPCNGVESCAGDGCLSGTPLVCDDANVCTTDSCDPTTGCVVTNGDGGGCSDQNGCTLLDECKSGVCQPGLLNACDDENDCTVDSCDPLAVTGDGCTHLKADGATCEDGDLCTQNDTCAAGACAAGPNKSCSDGLPCTTDSCSLGICEHVKQGLNTPCDSDGLACTRERCDASGTCGLSIEPGTCLIGGVCHPDGMPDPANPCQRCDAKNPNAFTVRPDGADCGVCAACVAGSCGFLADHSDCGACSKCTGKGQCKAQTIDEDVKSECGSSEGCQTGFCDGSGACGVLPDTVDCGICAQCDGAGACVADLSQQADCGSCRGCAGKGLCGAQATTEDLKDECETHEGCQTGFCNGAGLCGVSAAATACGVCARCDGFGACVAALDQHTDCGPCEKCTDKSACGLQDATEDLKDECSPENLDCSSELCDGSGACQIGPDLSPCEDGNTCTTADTCGAGLCVPGAEALFDRVRPHWPSAQFRAIAPLPDGGSAMAGHHGSDGIAGTEAWAVRLDASGNEVWDRSWPRQLNDSVLGLTGLADGGLALVGYVTPSFGSNATECWITRLDSNGTTVWERTHGGGFQRVCTAIVTVQDGGFAVLGTTFSSGEGNGDVWLLRLDAAGGPLFERTFGGIRYDGGTSLQALADGGFGLAGNTSSRGAGSSDVWLIRTDAEGNRLWDRTYGGSGYEAARALLALPDGGFALTSETDSQGLGASDAWLLRLDRLGDVLWSRTYGGTASDTVAGLAAMAGGGFALAGVTNSKHAGETDFWIVRTGADGAKMWERTYGTGQQESVGGLIAAPDGGVLLAGADRGFYQPYGDQTAGRLIRTDAWGNTSCAEAGPCGLLGPDECDDGQPCTLDLCNEEDGGCDHETLPDGTACSTGETCTAADSCQAGACVAGPPKLFATTYGGTEDDLNHALVAMPDGGFVMAGATASKGLGGRDFWVVLTNAAGATDWDTTHGGAGNDEAKAVAPLPYGAFVVAGDTDSTGAGGADILLMKLRSNGTEEWHQSFGGPQKDVAEALVVTADGGFAVAGTTYSKGVGGGDFWLVRTDPSGQLLWDRTFGGPGLEECFAMAVLPDGDLFLAGTTNSIGAGGTDLALVRLDSEGTTVWNKTHGHDQDETVQGVSALADGGFILAGSTTSKGMGSQDILLVLLNPDGDVLWERTYGGLQLDRAHAILEAPDRGFTIAGETASKGAGAADLWLLHTDSSGNPLWETVSGGGLGDSGAALALLPDGGVAVSGTTRSSGAGGTDAWLIRTDPFGNTSCAASGDCSMASLCDDGSPCTADRCDAAHDGCWSTELPDGASCDASEFCGQGSACAAGQCLAGASPDCDDGKVCTVDACDEAGLSTDRCAHVLTPGSPCVADAFACTDDTCDAAGACNASLIANTCLIAGACYGANEANPSRTCQSCKPELSQTAFTNEGEPCCSLTCPVGQGEAAACKVGADRTCEACSAGTFNAGDSLVCEACSGPCGAGTTLSAPCTAEADRVCAECRTCPAGSYPTIACTATSDTGCTPCTPVIGCAGTVTCSAPNTSQCVVCVVGSYLVNGTQDSCAPCSNTCPSGQGMFSACSATANRTCSVCGAGTYNTGIALTCQPCVPCVAGSTFETGACTVSKNRTCAACATTCPAGQGQLAACTITNNRTCTPCAGGTFNNGTALTCQPCTACSNGLTYQTGACFTAQNRICAPCTPCTAGRYQAAACTLTANAVCPPCAAIEDCDAVVCTTESDQTCATCKTGFTPSGSECVPL